MRILIVEDSPSMRAFISGVVEAACPGEVHEVGDGFAALKALHTNSFDLIIADVNMPGLNGLELLRYIKEHPVHSRIPVVIVSTENSPEDRVRGEQAGAVAYLGKPFEPEDLARIIQQHCVAAPVLDA